jgi:hypothetical protein
VGPAVSGAWLVVDGSAVTVVAGVLVSLLGVEVPAGVPTGVPAGVVVDSGVTGLAEGVVTPAVGVLVVGVPGRITSVVPAAGRALAGGVPGAGKVVSTRLGGL